MTQKSSNCKFHHLKSISDNDKEIEQNTTHRLRPSRGDRKKKNHPSHRSTSQSSQEQKRRHDDASEFNRTLLRALIDLTRSASWPRGWSMRWSMSQRRPWPLPAGTEPSPRPSSCAIAIATGCRDQVFLTTISTPAPPTPTPNSHSQLHTASATIQPSLPSASPF